MDQVKQVQRAGWKDIIFSQSLAKSMCIVIFHHNLRKSTKPVFDAAQTPFHPPAPPPKATTRPMKNPRIQIFASPLGLSKVLVAFL